MSNQPTSLPEEDIEFVMDTFQRSMGKSKPVRDTQIEGEKPQRALLQIVGGDKLIIPFC
ncbi:hypothetical protein N8R13_24670 [Enterobacter hormaechei subsp. steigerwaltii]|nr:hypothetical protein [Enterobacter hormaechei subsp. steigerwaltii]MCU3038303.1 hypothetical protein [Enterobacter hormaechei subsp. steigerwaltii]